jgi:glyoxylase-like metal-dependent hydrolase (beta-lactamase superfamily II)
MTAPARKREVGRGERLLPGVWRLRLPLPWPGVPHGNAWAVGAGDGIVLFDTGMHEPGSMANLERALDMVGLRVEHVRLLVCTHAHSDHYGQAAPIVARAGCELWMHPDHRHTTAAVDDPDAAFERRMEVARSAGVPEEPLRQWASARRGQA